MNEFTLADLRRVTDACLGMDNVTPIDASTAETQFSELGLDSLAVLELATRLQDELGIPVSDDALDVSTTPKQLVEYVNLELSQARR
jgi:act minimal PKS acyl carrier protein